LFSPGPPVHSTNKTDRHDITDILLKGALNTIKEERSKLWMELDSIAMPVLLFNAQVSFPKTITLQSYFYTKIIILGDNEVGKSLKIKKLSCYLQYQKYPFECGCRQL
jgi:hypothetical protein